MKMTNRPIRAACILVNYLSFAAAAFGDVPSPSPKQRPENMAGIDWGYILGIALFAFAGVLVIMWAGRKIYKRSSK